MTKNDLDYYKKLLLEIRENILKKYESTEEGLSKSLKDSSGEHSSYSFHLADLGTDTSEREKTFMMASMETAVLKEIEDSLVKIRSGDYGLCEACEGGISQQRLEAIPYAKLCLECKSKEEFAR